MSQPDVFDVTRCVEPDLVHKSVYTDAQIFDREMQCIFERVWVYCGHESQIPNAGDYVAVTIGRQPMVMVRATDRRIHVVHNRCPHRGVQVVGNTHGNTGAAFVCSYHAWSFHLDGSVRAIQLAKGYEGTRMDRSNPDCNLKRAARVDSYRGFVFASLSADGPSLLEFLGEAKIAFDDMCDRSPVGEVEIVPVCHRVIQHSNWKFFMENQLDALHPSVTHESSGRAAREVEQDIEKRTGKKAPLSYHYVSAFTEPFFRWDTLNTMGFANGHCTLEGYMGLRPKDPDKPVSGHALHTYAVDLARSPDGSWWVIGDHTQTPSGAGYALHNRIVTSQAFPDAFRELQVQTLATFFRTLQDSLARMAPSDGETPLVVLLSSGPYGESYFEHAFLARYLGFPLVEGQDLTVREDTVFLKTLRGLRRVHAILRRARRRLLRPARAARRLRAGRARAARRGARRARADGERAGRGRRGGQRAVRLSAGDLSASAGAAEDALGGVVVVRRGAGAGVRARQSALTPAASTRL